MRDVREEPAVQRAVDEACERWPRASEAWEAITWALARDPLASGSPLTESGSSRLLVFAGARSIAMPDVRVVYVVEKNCVSVREVAFSEATSPHAGLA